MKALLVDSAQDFKQYQPQISSWPNLVARTLGWKSGHLGSVPRSNLLCGVGLVTSPLYVSASPVVLEICKRVEMIMTGWNTYGFVGAGHPGAPGEDNPLA